MPKMLSEIVPGETPIFNAEALGQRPALAALVTEVIATWALVEAGLGACVAVMSAGINAAEIEGYVAAWSTDERLKIVRRLAVAELKGKTLDTFLQVLKSMMAVGQERHAFAHHVWGVVDALPNALLLIKPVDLMRHWGLAADWLAGFEEQGCDVGRFSSNYNLLIEVWTEQDIRDVLDRMRWAFERCVALRELAAKDPFDSSNARSNHVCKVLRAELARPGSAHRSAPACHSPRNI